MYSRLHGIGIGYGRNKKNSRSVKIEIHQLFTIVITIIFFFFFNLDANKKIANFISDRIFREIIDHRLVSSNFFSREKLTALSRIFKPEKTHSTVLLNRPQPGNVDPLDYYLSLARRWSRASEFGPRSPVVMMTAGPATDRHIAIIAPLARTLYHRWQQVV